LNLWTKQIVSGGGYPGNLKKRRINKAPAKGFFSQSGFTMIELMVVGAIVGILSAIAFTMLQDQLPRASAKSAARQLRTDLQKAKLEAIKRNTECLVVFTLAAGNASGSCQTCISSNDNDCADVSDIMVSDLDFDNYDNAELDSTNFTSTPQLFVFSARGMPERTGGGGMSGGTAVIETKDASYSISVIVSMTGRIRIE
jgi:prepilin-type N-terminal cleavage/methylation domain-containing protein